MTQYTTRRRGGFTLIEVVTVGLLSAIAATMVTPAVFSTRESARAAACRNRLKQVGLAMHNYSATHSLFPPGWTSHNATAGQAVHFGWMTAILPYLDQYKLYKQLDTNSHTISDRSIVDQRLAAYHCPSDTTPDQNPFRGGYGTSNYSGCYGPTAPPRWAMNGLSEFWPGQSSTRLSGPREQCGILSLNTNVRIRDVRDGLSNVFLVGERSAKSGSGIWIGVRGNQLEDDAVSDCSFGNEINRGHGFSSGHPGAAQFLLADGAVRSISEKVESKSGDGAAMGTYQKLSCYADGQVIGAF